MPRICRSLLGVLTLLVATQARAASHCQAGETDYFSCQIRGSQWILSICGSSGVTESSRSEAWLQYRFGRLNRIELAYPQSRSNSLASFHATDLTPIDDEGVRRDIFNLYFDIGPVNYNVEARDARRPFFGVVVTAGNKSVEYRCSGSFATWQRLQGNSFARLVVPLAK